MNTILDQNQSKLETFSYDRSKCSAGIIHVGVGAFHRAHQAYYFDRLLHIPDMQQWGIAGVNLRSQETALIDQLASQDHRYVLKTISPEGEVLYREIGSILETVDWSRDAQAAAQLAARPEIHIISMTVTESGYYLLDDSVLDLEASPVVEGLDKSSGSCIYTYLRAALNARMQADAGAVTLLCCDNLRDNGGKLKSGFTQYLKAANDTLLLQWVENQVTFPCCMVDRITPRMDHQHAEDVQQRFGINDQLTVMGEPFIQWVIEDNFAGQKPALDRVEVSYVEDVEPYEDAKIRVLNGGHTILTYLAALKGYHTYDQGIKDKELSEFFDRYETDEVIPAIGESPIDLYEYRDIIKQRFGNSNIGDTVARICMDGVSKYPIYILPTIAGSYRRGVVPLTALQGAASWYVFMRHVLAGKVEFEYIEPMWDWVKPMLESGNEKLFAGNNVLWSTLPQEFPSFVDDMTNAIKYMQQRFPLD
jgi:D-arabinitol 4-dehydrogenase